MRPPRAIEPEGFQIGNSLGRPNQPDLQRQVVQTAIEYMNQLVMPGKVTPIHFEGY